MAEGSPNQRADVLDETGSHNTNTCINHAETNEISITEDGTKLVRDKRLSRSERKRKRYEELRKQKKEDRKRKKNDKKLKQNVVFVDEDMKSKRELKQEIRQKCETALKLGQKICIDCSLEEHMSTKEKGKLAMQIGRLYGSNKKADNPAHIYITGLKQGGQLYQELVKKNDGFSKYLIDIEDKSHTEIFALDKIVVLSPDSDTMLENIEPDKVYVIGGLVDESVTKHITSSRAVKAGVCTARLPIDQYMTKLEQPSHSKVLAVNQVFDILLTYMSTSSWKKALATGVPRRKGFVVKDETS